ncbi:hypothetical protein KBD45_05540 [Candidatus Dojkabacteria bacterium]|nr:hypothetical protein [Candidatus Dojkabacteria bacterium]
MKWKIVDKTSVPTDIKKYRERREQIRQECGLQCVYCAIHEGQFGGSRNFHIEHYRPKSTFQELEHEYTNLFYSCCVCNCYKGSDWPDEPNSDLSNISYPCPSTTDFNNIFSLKIQNFHLEGQNTSSRYVIERLNLNRPMLITFRKKDCLLAKIDKLNQEIKETLLKVDNEIKSKFNERFTNILTEVISVMTKYDSCNPYESSDLLNQAIESSNEQ